MHDFIDLLDYEDDEYAFARPYIDLLCEYFDEYHPKVVYWNSPGYTQLPPDEVRVVLQRGRRKAVEIIIVPSNRPTDAGVDFGISFAGAENNPLSHRSQFSFLTLYQVIEHVEAIFQNKMCAIIVKNYAGETLSSELAWTIDVPLGKPKRMFYHAPDDANGYLVDLRSVKTILVRFYSLKDRIYHY